MEVYFPKYVINFYRFCFDPHTYPYPTNMRYWKPFFVAQQLLAQLNLEIYVKLWLQKRFPRMIPWSVKLRGVATTMLTTVHEACKWLEFLGFNHSKMGMGQH